MNTEDQIIRYMSGLETEEPWPRAIELHLRPVAPVEGYFPELSQLSTDQRKFYREWRAQYEDGKPYLAPVGFLYLYCYDIIQENWSNWDKIAWLMAKMAYAYEFAETKVAQYALRWCADASVAGEYYARAIYFLRIGFRPGPHTLNEMFNLRYRAGYDMDEVELLRQAVLGPRLKPTKFAIDHIREVADEVRQLLSIFKQQNGQDLLHFIARKYPAECHYSLYIFSGSKFASALEDIHTFCFYAIPEFTDLVGRISREAENIVRTRYGKRILDNEPIRQFSQIEGHTK